LIDHYIKINRQPPTKADIQHYFQTTPPSVHQMILKREERGFISFITRVPGQARSITVLLPPEELPPLK
jgi:repressor LexA